MKTGALTANEQRLHSGYQRLREEMGRKVKRGDRASQSFGSGSDLVLRAQRACEEKRGVWS